MSLMFVLIYILNWLYPLFSDDWFYSFIYNEQNIRVSSLSDIIASQYNHYFVWGGRNVVHAIDQFFLMNDFSVYCFFNSLVYTLFIYLLYKIANKDNTTNSSVFIVFSLLIWFLQPAFFETVIWKTGSANYLWGTFIILVFIYPYYLYYNNKGYATDKYIRPVFFFFGGIIAGWTNENMSVAILFYIAGLVTLIKIERRPIPKWMIFGLVGAIVGCAFMLSAPGNYIRVDDAIDTYGWQNKSFFQVLFYNSRKAIGHFVKYLLPILGMYFVLLALYIKYPKEIVRKKNILYNSIIFLVTGFVALCAMIASPVFPTRALFGIIVFFLIPVGILYANIDMYKLYLKYVNIVLVTGALLFFSIGYYTAYKDLYTVNVFFRERELLIEEQKIKGIDSIVFTKAMPAIDEERYFIWDLTEDPQGWTNKAFARYHGLKSTCLIVDTLKQE
jgi:hypothetical protein